MQYIAQIIFPNQTSATVCDHKTLYMISWTELTTFKNCIYKDKDKDVFTVIPVPEREQYEVLRSRFR